MTDAPLVSLRDLRVDVDGAAVVDHVTFTSSGHSLAVWADDLAFERALAGAATIRTGELSVLGHQLNGARAPLPFVGVALGDPPLPASWTVRQYLIAGATLAGCARREAQRASERALATLGLESLARARCGELPVAERRAVVLAQAIAAEPTVLIAIAPLAGLSAPGSAYVAAVFAAAVRGRRWIASVRDLHPASSEYALAGTADQVLGLVGGRLVQHGTLKRSVPPPRASASPATPSSTIVGYTLVVRGDVAALRAALQARGVTLAGGPVRFFVELSPPFSTTELLTLAHATHTAIIELLPRVARSSPSASEI